MAIIIPSKNIYSKQNPKIRDNVVNKVEIDKTSISKKYEYKTPVFNKQIDTNLIISGDIKTKYDSDIKITSTTQIYGGSKSYAELKSSYILNHYIEFLELEKNTLINKVYDGVDKEQENNIKYTLFYNKKIFNISVDDINQISGNTVSFENYNETLIEDIDTSGVIPNPEIKIGSTDNVNPYASSYAEIIEENLTNLATLTIDFNKETKKFFLYVTILVGLETMGLTGLKRGGSSAEVSKIACTGQKIIYTPKSLELTIYGDTIGVDLTNGTVTYKKDGTKGDKPISLNGNELMQDSATTGDKPTTKFLAQNVLEQYKSGKETAVLRCDIANYFDENGEKAISIDFDNKPMLLEIGDEVVPMVRAVDGTDRPMSKKQDGTAKSFIIVGKEPIYSGAVWQEITLQEK